MLPPAVRRRLLQPPPAQAAAAAAAARQSLCIIDANLSPSNHAVVTMHAAETPPGFNYAFSASSIKTLTKLRK